MLAQRPLQFGGVGLQCRVWIGQRHRPWQRVQGRRGQQRAQIGRQGVRGGPQPGQRLQRGRIIGVHAPQIGGEFLQQLAVTGQQLGRVEGMAAFQRMLAQHADAAAVDGDDRSQIDLVGGDLQATLQRSGALGVTLQMALQHFAHRPGARPAPAARGYACAIPGWRRR
ncbi:hypothetical protein G6F63_014793 [Rhizopus arrhizus]|nr:hypothetical protein G6F63_014793 [Rhizopus arrhizus]